MRAKIDEYGQLFLERNNILRMQLCPHNTGIMENNACGDHCPLFGEPGYQEDEVFLNLCQVDLWFLKEDFKDERS